MKSGLPESIKDLAEIGNHKFLSNYIRPGLTEKVESYIHPALGLWWKDDRHMS